MLRVSSIGWAAAAPARGSYFYGGETPRVAVSHHRRRASALRVHRRWLPRLNVKSLPLCGSR